MDLKERIITLKGIGEKSAALFAKLDIFTIYDLIRYFPRSYETFQEPVTVKSAVPGEMQSFCCRITGTASMKKIKNLTVLTIAAADQTDSLIVTFFNMPYLKNTLKKGETFVFRGVYRNGKLEHPRIYKPEDYRKLLSSIQPSYSLTKGLTNQGITKAVRQALSLSNLQDEERLPLWIRERYHLMGYEEAIDTMHFPESFELLAKARRRLVFEEFFLFLLLVRNNKASMEQEKSPYPMIETSDVQRLQEALPYQLTNAQTQVLDELMKDMTSGYVMSRLIQGDVGSGKTILAVLALLLCVSNGYQGVMMAPTEVLAEQHFAVIKELTEKYRLPFQPALLTGSVTVKEKGQVYDGVRLGAINLVIGTHAVIQEKVEFKNLALVITDEQHRFGVRQRERLAGKGGMPHILVMSATPIPRSLAMILYGDLKISVIKELPAHRLPVKNCVVGTGYRSTAYRFIEKEVRASHQVYVICPMVESGDEEASELENVMEYTEKLRNELPADIQVGTLHGKMKPAEKHRIMQEFHRHHIDVLVSTTVIEVGINVPNATVMLVENAERFGLAQLHQLRGRVGRGDAQSYCIFISGSDKKETLKRLEILNQSNDGFFIASEDLRLRGPGDLFGIRQSGDMAFELADIYQDSDVLKDAAECAELLFEGKGDIFRDMIPYFIQSLEAASKNHIDFHTI